MNYGQCEAFRHDDFNQMLRKQVNDDSSWDSSSYVCVSCFMGMSE
jgi:hypothetical protein